MQSTSASSNAFPLAESPAPRRGLGSAWMIVAALLSTVLGAALVTFAGWHALTLHNIGPLLGIGLTATFGQLAMTRAYKVGRKLVAANLSYLTVVFSSLLGALLWGDKLPLDSYVAIVVIVCSGIIASRR